MKKPLEICVLFFVLFSYSCEKSMFHDEIIDILTINGETHSFINSEGKPFYDNYFTSLNDRHVYKLKMSKNVEYRISASQPGAYDNRITLTLVNKANVTLTTSFSDHSTKSTIFMVSPETTDYYLIVNLEKWPNPKFGYRLNFEEFIEHPISFSGFNWTYDGTWQLNNSNEVVMTNYNSNIFRHLRFNCTGLTNPDVSFVIMSNSTLKPNFGFATGESAEYNHVADNSNELPKVGYALFTYNHFNGSFYFCKLNNDFISYTENLVTKVLDYSSGIKIDLKYNSTEKYYTVYFNNDLYQFIQDTIRLNYFYILVQDSGTGTTVIKDLIITNGPS
jgi:hypothetical protein